MRRRLPVRAKAAAPLPPYQPVLAATAQTPPEGNEWLHELLRGGRRIGCAVLGGKARLFDAEGHDCTSAFPRLAAAMASLPVKQASLDGEVALLLPDGRTTASPLDDPVAADERRGVTYFLFDLLHLDGKDLTARPLEVRKRQLAALLNKAAVPALRYADHIRGHAQHVLAQACALGVDGIVSKHSKASYQPTASAFNDRWHRTPCTSAREGVVMRPAGQPLSASHSKQRGSVAGIRISTPDRPVYPALGSTKRDLALYYADVAERMLPYIARRPLTLVRCERGVTRADGLRSECKFLRHAAGWHRWVHPPIERVLIPEQKKMGEYLVVDSVEGLVSLVQGDILEIHVWNSTVDQLETPDRLVLDIDPGPEVPWDEVIETAQRLRAQLEQLGLASWPKLTGGKGLHVVVPFQPEHGWDIVYETARGICEQLVRQRPEQLTLAFATKGRGRKILLDYKRNHRAAVAVAAYSARAHPGGTVSLPISWGEPGANVRSDAFDINSARARLRAHPVDPWSEFWLCRQRLRPQ